MFQRQRAAITNTHEVVVARLSLVDTSNVSRWPNANSSVSRCSNAMTKTVSLARELVLVELELVELVVELACCSSELLDMWSMAALLCNDNDV